MAREAQFINYTGEEALAHRAYDLERDGWYRAFRRVEELLSDRDGARDALSDLEVRHMAVVHEYPHLLHARLCRVMPHHADIFTFLFWPEFMPTPEWVDQRGLPEPWAVPGRSPADRCER